MSTKRIVEPRDRTEKAFPHEVSLEYGFLTALKTMIGKEQKIVYKDEIIATYVGKNEDASTGSSGRTIFRTRFTTNKTEDEILQVLIDIYNEYYRTDKAKFYNSTSFGIGITTPGGSSDSKLCIDGYEEGKHFDDKLNRYFPLGETITLLRNEKKEVKGLTVFLYRESKALCAGYNFEEYSPRKDNRHLIELDNKNRKIQERSLRTRGYTHGLMLKNDEEKKYKNIKELNLKYLPGQTFYALDSYLMERATNQESIMHSSFASNYKISRIFLKKVYMDKEETLYTFIHEDNNYSLFEVILTEEEVEYMLFSDESISEMIEMQEKIIEKCYKTIEKERIMSKECILVNKFIIQAMESEPEVIARHLWSTIQDKKRRIETARRTVSSSIEKIRLQRNFIKDLLEQKKGRHNA